MIVSEHLKLIGLIDNTHMPQGKTGPVLSKIFAFKYMVPHLSFRREKNKTVALKDEARNSTRALTFCDIRQSFAGS